MVRRRSQRGAARAAAVLGPLLALLALAPGTARSDDDATATPRERGAGPCRASVAVTPAAAVPGQQLLYAVRIARREDVRRVEWTQAPRFPDFRAEWLPGRAEDTERLAGGRRFLVREEQRAIFPLRTGELVIPSAALRCTLVASAADRPEPFDAQVPAARVRVRPVPVRGRPADWSGVVGPVQVQTVADPLVLPLGRALRVSVLLRGPANLWDAAAPFAGAFGDDEVFAERPELRIQAGERLQVRRFFRFDVVPGSAGTLVVPAVRVPWYDPRTGRYEVARAEAIEVRVAPEPAAGDDEAKAAARRRAGAPAARAGSPGTARAADRPPTTVLALLALAATFATGLALHAAWSRRRRPWREVESALLAAEGSAAEDDLDGEAAELALALRRAVAAYRREPDLARLDASELRERCADDAAPALAAALDELDRIERLRFSAERQATHRAAVARAIRALRQARDPRRVTRLAARRDRRACSRS